MSTNTVTGTALFISAAAPVTRDKAGFAALSYTEIMQVEKIGAIGGVSSKVGFTPLKGPKQKHKGPIDYGSLVPSMAHDETDPGQEILRTAADPAITALYSYMVVYPDWATRFFLGRAFGYPEVTDGADTMLMANPTIEIWTPISKIDAAEAPSGGTLNFLDPDNSILMGAL